MVQYQSMTFQMSDLDDFNDLDKREQCYPCSPRFKACDADTGKMQRVKRTHYFPHLFVARQYVAQGLEVWQERYKLSKKIGPGSVYFPFNEEIIDRMGANVKRAIEEEARKLRHEFRAPDLVTHSPSMVAWRFVEIKRSDTRDWLDDEQLRSLELLERVVPESVPIVMTLSPE